MYPDLLEGAHEPGPTTTIGTPVEHLDLATVLKVSQAVSGEIVLEKLIDTLLHTAIEHAGAERGLLILQQGSELRIQAEAVADGSSISINLRDAPISSTELPESVVRFAARTQEIVILDDASSRGSFASDDYIRRKHARSVLCLPLMKQGKPVALLYLENKLAPRVFTRARVAVLKLLASEAATSLENSRLYRELQEREAKIRRLVDANIIGILIFDLEGRILEANDAFLRMVGYDREDLVSGRMRWTDLTPPKWRDRTAQVSETEYFRKDGRRVPVLVGAASFEETGNQGVAFVLDLTERKQAEAKARESERRYHDVQMELAHANRIATLGELATSIAHEINQPLTAIVTNGETSLRWLARADQNIEKVTQLTSRIVSSARRAGEIIHRIRGMAAKNEPEKSLIDLNEIVEEALLFMRHDIDSKSVVLSTTFGSGLPRVMGDRIQLQQVIINLLVNSVQAIAQSGQPTRRIDIHTSIDEEGSVVFSIFDNGPGIASADLPHVFDSFFSTKDTGIGIGLAICQSIIAAHGGSILGSNRPNGGAHFHFALPVPAVDGADSGVTEFIRQTNQPALRTKSS
jgi:PAS domain S-box-containing protein